MPGDATGKSYFARIEPQVPEKPGYPRSRGRERPVSSPCSPRLVGNRSGSRPVATKKVDTKRSLHGPPRRPCRVSNPDRTAFQPHSWTEAASPMPTIFPRAPKGHAITRIHPHDSHRLAEAALSTLPPWVGNHPSRPNLPAQTSLNSLSSHRQKRSKFASMVYRMTLVLSHCVEVCESGQGKDY